jgi:hypothetical protein
MQQLTQPNLAVEAQQGHIDPVFHSLQQIQNLRG